MIELLSVGVGGFIGSCIRYGISKLLANQADFPLATLTANVIAGFLIGFITVIYERTDFVTARQKLMLTTGMLGGLSTFSTFSLETVDLLTKGSYTLAFTNILLNVALSLLGVMLGMWAAHTLRKAVL